MDKTDNIRMKHVEANLEHLNPIPDKVSDTSVGFQKKSETTGIAQQILEMSGNIWNYCFPCW